MTKLLRDWARSFGYRSGVWSAFRHRDVLTVVMFHRIIARKDPRFSVANPSWTIEEGVFYEMLKFFKDHFCLVSLDDVLGALDHRARLPDYPLLVTFDDGWADNRHYAAPLIHNLGIPAVVFVAVQAMLSAAQRWWQEEVLEAARRFNLGCLDPNPDIKWPDDVLDALCHFAELEEEYQNHLLERIRTLGISESLEGSRMMLVPSQLAELSAAGFAIANHTYSHLPLTKIASPEAEIRKGQEIISQLTGVLDHARALSCPHGCVNAGVIQAARAAGVRALFTSQPTLNPITDGFLDHNRPIGRIHVTGLVDQRGHLDRGAMATWLWRRSVDGV